MILNKARLIYRTERWLLGRPLLVKETAIINVSSLGLKDGPGAGDYVRGASYGGSGGNDVEDLFSYAYHEQDIIGNPINEYLLFVLLIIEPDHFYWDLELAIEVVDVCGLLLNKSPSTVILQRMAITAIIWVLALVVVQLFSMHPLLLLRVPILWTIKE